MNAREVFDKYTEALMDLGMSDGAAISADAILLALRLAIGEAYTAGVPESALVAAQNETAMLRQQLATERAEVRTLIEEIESLRQQLAQMDADNANLTRKLAVANSHIVALTDRIHADESNIHVNGNGHVNGAAPATPAVSFNWNIPIEPELADFRESLDKGRRTFRQLEKYVRLGLVQTALASFAELPTQAAFNAAKPEWMPQATTLCTTFNCKWEELPPLNWEQVKA